MFILVAIAMFICAFILRDQTYFVISGLFSIASALSALVSAVNRYLKANGIIESSDS